MHAQLAWFYFRRDKLGDTLRTSMYEIRTKCYGRAKSIHISQPATLACTTAKKKATEVDNGRGGRVDEKVIIEFFRNSHSSFWSQISRWKNGYHLLDW